MDKQREILEGIIDFWLQHLVAKVTDDRDYISKDKRIEGHKQSIADAILSAGFVHKDSLSEEKIADIIKDTKYPDGCSILGKMRYGKEEFEETRNIIASAIAKGEIWEG